MQGENRYERKVTTLVTGNANLYISSIHPMIVMFQAIYMTLMVPHSSCIIKGAFHAVLKEEMEQHLSFLFSRGNTACE